MPVCIPETGKMICAYVQDSALGEDDASLACQYQSIQLFTRENNLTVDVWHRGIDTEETLVRLHAGDTLLVCRFSSLGVSLKKVWRSLSVCWNKNIKIIVIQDKNIFEKNSEMHQLLEAMELVVKIETDIRSQSVRRRLQQRRREGKVLGRPFGSRNRKTKLSGREEEITSLLAQKVSKSAIAKRLGVNRMTLYGHLRRMEEQKAA